MTGCSRRSSHLPHLLAFAYVDELAARSEATETLAHAGTGFRDFTRIAAASPEMWRDIALANRVALQEELGKYRHALERLASALDARDGAALERSSRDRGRRGKAGKRRSATATRAKSREWPQRTPCS